ncbi:MAG TPA: DNA alkylation repair protein [Kiritimatiellia bacterium]|nr:DNA alkylation repair protein [Kiritimatiellia bacterium]
MSASPTAANIRRSLHTVSDASRAPAMQRFFKTGPGEYAEGDVFIGVTMPHIRMLARQYYTAPLDEIPVLLASKIHEERMLGLLILVRRHQKDPASRDAVYRMYTKHMKWINNWDLIDVTAEHVIGAHLYERNRTPLYTWAASKSIWPRRIAIMTTFHFIKRGDFEDTLRLATIYLNDAHDLIHKATGWMLREIGNRNREVEIDFLQKHAATMPRVMLRYAIEKFPKTQRMRFMLQR